MFIKILNYKYYSQRSYTHPVCLFIMSKTSTHPVYSTHPIYLTLKSMGIVWMVMKREFSETFDVP